MNAWWSYSPEHLLTSTLLGVAQLTLPAQENHLKGLAEAAEYSFRTAFNLAITNAKDSFELFVSTSYRERQKR